MSSARLACIALTLAGSVGCEFGFTLPSDEPKPEGPAAPGVVDLRTRRPILPGTLKGPPPPDQGIRASECEDMTDGGPLSGPDCVTGQVACGQTVVGHTRGGTRRFDTRFYESNYCWPGLEQWDGGDERVYQFQMPAQTRAYITLDTPCADLDMMAMKWSGNECPSSKSRITQCEMIREDGTERETVILETIKPTTWLLSVEGVRSEEGAFAVHVQCFQR